MRTENGGRVATEPRYRLRDRCRNRFRNRLEASILTDARFVKGRLQVSLISAGVRVSACLAPYFPQRARTCEQPPFPTKRAITARSQLDHSQVFAGVARSACIFEDVESGVVVGDVEHSVAVHKNIAGLNLPLAHRS
jgi:hypothetical protein